MCSYPAGQNELGLCDLYGNVSEYVLDSSAGSGPFPLDGSAYTNSATCGPGSPKYAAGTSHLDKRSNQRALLFTTGQCYDLKENVGFRLVRLPKPWRRKRLPVLID